MLFVALPSDWGQCRWIGLNVTVQAGRVSIPTLLCDGGTPAGVFPARLISDDETEEEIYVRCPAFEDGIYEAETLEITTCP